ncbi:hypothetical protein H1S01_07225 [Heliobacterium chlorum]|uniref:Uncharacterized protein n=1 Tax=Heliobacterium chlorum TaxID=2698 RepID=A0ABR7T3Q0_HELCL|nr:hypothetical protein [Heliobacterium chlorum]MBC9784301.1 hypothetical protein [Heliobacterium chlorum]
MSMTSMIEKETLTVEPKATFPGVKESAVDRDAVKDFLKFIEKNKHSLRNGMGAFHTDNHSNW